MTESSPEHPPQPPRLLPHKTTFGDGTVYDPTATLGAISFISTLSSLASVYSPYPRSTLPGTESLPY